MRTIQLHEYILIGYFLTPTKHHPTAAESSQPARPHAPRAATEKIASSGAGWPRLAYSRAVPSSAHASKVDWLVIVVGVEPEHLRAETDERLPRRGGGRSHGAEGAVRRGRDAERFRDRILIGYSLYTNEIRGWPPIYLATSRYCTARSTQHTAVLSQQSDAIRPCSSREP